MEALETTESITRTIFAREKIEEHPLFIHLSQNILTGKQIRKAALQIYHVVLHFPRFLSAILTNIPDYQLRMPLVENLFEEHGRLNERYVHSQTYKQFLMGIGLSEKEIAGSKPTIQAMAYNRAMIDLCLHHPFAEGLAALGIVEEIVARVSPIIGAFALKKFPGGDGSLFHFTSHATLDISHAKEIYELVDLNYNESNKELIMQGFELGMYYHKRLYTDILEYIKPA